MSSTKRIYRSWHGIAIAAFGLLGAAVAFSTSSAVMAQTNKTGSVTGRLLFPGEESPPMRICAIDILNRSIFHCVFSRKNQGNYTITNVRPGSYYVVTYPRIPVAWGITEVFIGGYTKTVTCGNKFGCADHSLISVKVKAGHVTRYIDPTDWLAPDPEELFPTEPPR